MVDGRQPLIECTSIEASPDLFEHASVVRPLALLSRVPVLWHLLSLDAPTVAVLWTVFLARVAHVLLPLSTSVAMAVGVWMLYAADRLFDTSHLSVFSGDELMRDLEPRHLFHHRYRTAFAIAIAVAAVLLSLLIPRLSHAAIDLYFIEAALLASYFLLIHAAPVSLRRAVPKEFLVGVFFAAATFIPSLTGAAAPWSTIVICAFLFGALCTLNCLYIYVWEHPDAEHPHGPTRMAIRLLLHGTIALIALSLGVIVFSAGVREVAFYPVACALSALALRSLHHFRSHLSRVGLRAAADAALLTPVLFFAFRS